MTRDDIIRMARKVWIADDDIRRPSLAHLEAFANLVAAAEREACARIAETAFPFHCEDLIRARGNK